jgi:hypothetical protein
MGAHRCEAAVVVRSLLELTVVGLELRFLHQNEHTGEATLWTNGLDRWRGGAAAHQQDLVAVVAALFLEKQGEKENGDAGLALF